jgi:hypothetical protein
MAILGCLETCEGVALWSAKGKGKLGRGSGKLSDSAMFGQAHLFRRIHDLPHSTSIPLVV